MPLDAIWLGKTLQQRVGLSSPMCPECLGTNAPLHSPLESIQGSDRCLFIKEEKKKCGLISQEKEPPTWNMWNKQQCFISIPGNIQQQEAGDTEAFDKLFACFRVRVVCVCPTRLSPCAVSTCICSRRCAQLHLITHALSQLQALHQMIWGTRVEVS